MYSGELRPQHLDHALRHFPRAFQRLIVLGNGDLSLSIGTEFQLLPECGVLLVVITREQPVDVLPLIVERIVAEIDHLANRRIGDAWANAIALR